MDGERIAWIFFKTSITMKELNRKIIIVLISVPNDGYNSINISCFKNSEIVFRSLWKATNFQ